MNTIEDFMKEMTVEAKQVLGTEKAEEVTDLHKTISAALGSTIACMTLTNMLVVLGEEDSMEAIQQITHTSFCTGMLGYREFLLEIDPEAADRVDAKLREMAEEKANE
jgi:hypothetical protein